jgi:hypothetical protein
MLRAAPNLLLTRYCCGHFGQSCSLEVIHHLRAKVFPSVVQRAGGLVRAALQADGTFEELIQAVNRGYDITQGDQLRIARQLKSAAGPTARLQ